MKSNTISAGDNVSENKEKPSPEPLDLEALYHRYGIERSHADNVARNVLELFDILAPFHGLGSEFRKLVEIAALVHDSGVTTDLENHHKAGGISCSCTLLPICLRNYGRLLPGQLSCIKRR